MPVPDPTPWRLRAAASAMTERPCWDADVPVAALAAAPWPILVVVGDWAGAPEDYRRHAGEPLTVTARAVARRTGGRLQVVPGYYPQTQQADLVNDALAALWAAAGL
ncbi:hypothetical protein SAMN05216207_100419 [Pseudonocardia ammonioxydans]|uniref:Alpha/beta hydrolase fold n=1 Tax=Pseudonocardia ammonioxydans TaxID=260086 RepID=A0A1I4UCF0_PSUAM|nr:hypothetical protein [Pseudonocardia ammonioxydans]SFM86664.1 hypothetical protein SAMN05216207_100419 [Pseudonocardia ammonioxydans]